MKKALVQNVVHTIKNKKTGATVNFLGSLKTKPKGWIVVPNTRTKAMGTQSGTC